MSVYPLALDSDETILRVDDNLSELGTEVINQQRDAIFNMQKEMGIGLSGAMSSLADRLAVAINANGTIKASALTSIGLATLPIVNAQVATNAGIEEYKLTLDYPTSNLNTNIQTVSGDLASLIYQFNIAATNFTNHLIGSTFLADGITSARHTSGQIDLGFSLYDKNSVLRSAVNVGSALLQINTDLVNHENAVVGAHVATAITVDTENYREIPTTANTAQKIFDYFDQAEILSLGNHRATQHANGIPSTARVAAFDGYGGGAIVPQTTVRTYLISSPATGPEDSIDDGDDLIEFIPDNSGFKFDAIFSQAKVGDTCIVNYGNGIETSFIIDSIKYSPGRRWVVRINGVNLFDSNKLSLNASARINRTSFDTSTAGVLAVAACNAMPVLNYSSDLFGSVIIGSPHGATALGLGFDSGQLDSTHYKLYLEIYPTGNPEDNVFSLPAIDVTGNAGITPGLYTLDSVVQSTNNAFRELGYNYRFIAFSHNGEFGIMLADAINNVSFAIVSGDSSSGTLATGAYTENVIGGSTLDDFDALGFGAAKAVLASPTYHNTFTDYTAARLPTKIIHPFKNRFFNVNGIKRETFAQTISANVDGYWPATIYSTNTNGLTTEITYEIDLNLSSAKLKRGKTLVVQPTISFSDILYNTSDYGRFIIKEVSLTECDLVNPKTYITVINGIYGSGDATEVVSRTGLSVQVYFSEDSVGFDYENIINIAPTSLDYNRLHEICIDESGITFAHERARLPRQAGDSDKLSTPMWHIKSMSPKLRGYYDSSTDVQKYIRLYISSYDTISGEFDGYLSKRVFGGGAGAGALIGGTVTGRKNVVTRFYDETNVDYIDFEYVDASALGTDVLPTARTRYVDIELFPSMLLNDTVMVLATCEVNWSPEVGANIIQSVKDMRQFGSVSELNLTQSAKDFISSADRILHANGIIRGLDVDSVSSDNREVYFKGGSAIVNGSVVSVNNSAVTIPRVYSYGDSLSVVVDWVICVNEYGKLVPILLTSSKTQYFATPNGSSSYYLPSVTLSELINTRKDLTPIAIASPTIGSFVLTNGEIKDIRMFVKQASQMSTITWSSGDVSANFNDIEALKTWVNNYSSGINQITVKGNFTITSEIDMTGFNYPTIFNGDGAVFEITSTKGILVNSNLTFKNIHFKYNPTGTYTDTINYSNGCLFNSDSISDFSVIDCTFSSQLSGYRPPFISILSSASLSIFNNINILNCKFSDNNNTSGLCAAIYIANIGSSDDLTIANLDICKNHCDKNQTISLSHVGTSSNVPINCSISQNNCGAIGYLTTSTQNGVSFAFGGSIRNFGISIQENTCHLISHIGSTGNFVTVNYSLSNAIISKNNVNYIYVINNDSSVNTYSKSSLVISENNLNAYDGSVVGGYLRTNFSNIAENTAIAVLNTSGVVNSVQQSCRIVNNKISGSVKSLVGPTYYYYTRGIGVYGSSAIISGNEISGVLTESVSRYPNTYNGIDIFVIGYPTIVGAATSVTITNNQLFSNFLAGGLDSYISGESGKTLHCQVTDNFFDYYYANGTDEELVKNTDSNWIVERNKNQTVDYKLSPAQGVWGTGNTSYQFIFGESTTTADLAVLHYASNEAKIDYTSPNSKEISWIVNLNEVLPQNAHIVNISLELDASVAFSVTSSWYLQLKGTGLTTLNETGAPTTVSTTLKLLTMPVSDTSYTTNGTTNMQLIMFGDMHSVSNSVVTLTNPLIKFRW